MLAQPFAQSLDIARGIGACPRHLDRAKHPTAPSFHQHQPAARNRVFAIISLPSLQISAKHPVSIPQLSSPHLYQLQAPRNRVFATISLPSPKISAKHPVSESIPLSSSSLRIIPLYPQSNYLEKPHKPRSNPYFYKAQTSRVKSNHKS